MSDDKILNMEDPGGTPRSLGGFLDRHMDLKFRRQIGGVIDAVSEVSGTIDDIMSVVDGITAFASSTTAFFELVGLLGGMGKKDPIAAQLELLDQHIETLYHDFTEAVQQARAQDLRDKAAVVKQLGKYVEDFPAGVTDDGLMTAFINADTAYSQLLDPSRWCFYFWPGTLEASENPPLAMGVKAEMLTQPGSPWVVPLPSSGVPSALVDFVRPPSAYKRNRGDADSIRFNYMPVLTLLEVCGLTLMRAIAFRASRVERAEVKGFQQSSIETYVDGLRGLAAAMDACVMITRPITRQDDAYAYQQCRAVMERAIDLTALPYHPSPPPEDELRARVLMGNPTWPFEGRRPPSSVEGWPVGAMNTCTPYANIEARWKVPDGPGAGEKVSGCFDEHHRDDAYYEALNCAAWPVILNARRGVLLDSGFYSLLDLIEAMERWLPPGSRAPLGYLSRSPALGPVLQFARTKSLRGYLDKAHPKRNKAASLSLRPLLERGIVAS